MSPVPVEKCVSSERWAGKTNPRTNKPYTESEKWAICNWAHEKRKLSESGTILEGVSGKADIGYRIQMIRWSTAYINSLPNSSFAVVEPAYVRGSTENKNCRHLPFKGKDGKVDLPHLRNALVRVNQINPLSKSISVKDLRSAAKRKLIPYAKEFLPDSIWAGGQNE